MESLSNPPTGKQCYSICNMCVAGSFLSLVGVQRGLGVMSHQLLIGGDQVTWAGIVFNVAVNNVG